jgi:hypothetical protein
MDRLIQFLDQLFRDEVESEEVPLEFAKCVKVPGELPKFVLFYEGNEYELILKERVVKRPEKRALYFGCTSGGHFLQSDKNERDSLDPKEDHPGFPWDHRLVDGGLLKNGKIPDTPNGKVYWTCGGKPDLWHAFYWWDRSRDKRPGSNSGFYVRGFGRGEVEAAFAYACSVWPKIVDRQKHPLELVLTGRWAPC